MGFYASINNTDVEEVCHVRHNSVILFIVSHIPLTERCYLHSYMYSNETINNITQCTVTQHDIRLNNVIYTQYIYVVHKGMVNNK